MKEESGPDKFSPCAVQKSDHPLWPVIDRYLDAVSRRTANLTDASKAEEAAAVIALNHELASTAAALEGRSENV